MADKHKNASLEDVSQMRRPIQISGKPIEQVLNSVHYGSPELRCLLMDECHLIFECKVCRALFRDLPNFISHKRAYCTKSSLDDRHEAITELPEEKVMVVQPEAPEDHVAQGSSEPQVKPVSAIQRPKRRRMGLEDTIHRIQSGELGKSNGYKVYTEAAEKLQRQKESMKVATIRTKEIPTNKNAVFIDVKMTSVSIHDRPNHEDISSRNSEDKEKPEMNSSAMTRKAGEKVSQSSQSSRVPKGVINKLLMQQLKDLKRMKHNTVLMDKDSGESVEQNCALKNVQRPSDANKRSSANASGSTADTSLNESASENVAHVNLTNDLRDLARQNFESLLAHAEENIGPKAPPDSPVNEDRAVVRRRFASNHSVKNSSFTDKAKLLVKSRSRSCKKSLSCSVCNSVFSTWKSLQFHLKVHHSNAMTYYPCPYCPSVFHYFHGVTRHLISNHSKTTDEVDKMRKELKDKAYTKTISLLKKETQEHHTTAKESLQSLRTNRHSVKKEACITGVKCSRKDPTESENSVENVSKALKKSQGSSTSSRSKRFTNRVSKRGVQDNVRQTSSRVFMDETEVGFMSMSKSGDNQGTPAKVCPGCERSFGRKISFDNHVKSCKAKEKHLNSLQSRSPHYQITPATPNSSVADKKNTMSIPTRNLNSPRTNTRQMVKEARHRDRFQKTDKSVVNVHVQNLHSNNSKITHSRTRNHVEYEKKERLSSSPQISATRLRRRHTICNRDLNRERMLSYRHARSKSVERCKDNMKQKGPQTQRRVKSGLVSSSAVTLTSPLLTCDHMEPKNFGSENVEGKQTESSDVDKGGAQDSNGQPHVDDSKNNSTGQKYGQRELIMEGVPEDKAVNKFQRRTEQHDDTLMKKVDPVQQTEGSSDSTEKAEKRRIGNKEDTKDVEIISTQASVAQNCVRKGELIKTDKEKTCENFVEDVKPKLEAKEERMDVGYSTSSGDRTSASKDLKIKNKQVESVVETMDRGSHPQERISGSCLNVRETDVSRPKAHRETESQDQKPASSEVPSVVQALSERPKRKRKIPSRNLDAEEIVARAHSGDRDRRLAKRVKFSNETPSDSVKKLSRNGLSKRGTNPERCNKNRRKLRIKDDRRDRSEIERNVQSRYGNISKRMNVLDEQKTKGRNIYFDQSKVDRLIDEKSLCCRACGVQYSQMYLLKKHIRQRHLKVSSSQLKLDTISEKKESEQKLKKKFIGEDKVRDRSRRMSNRLYVLDGRKPKGKKLVCYDQSKVDKLVDGKNLSCLECGEVFSQICNLRRHTIRCHLKWVRFRCKLCKFQCFDRSECFTHIIRVHKNTPRRGMVIDLAKQGASARSQKKTQTLRVKQKMEGTAGNIYARPNVRQGLRLSQRVTNLNEGRTEKVKPELEINCESDSSVCHTSTPCVTQSGAVDKDADVAEGSKTSSKSKTSQSQELVMYPTPITTPICSGEQTTRTYVVAGSSVSVFSEKSEVSVSVSSPSTHISTTSLDKHAASSSTQPTPTSALLRTEPQDKTTRKSMPFNISTRNSPRMFNIHPYGVENGIIHKKDEADDKTTDNMEASTPSASGSESTDMNVVQEAPIDQVQVIPESHESVIQCEPSPSDNSPKSRNIFDELRGEARDTCTAVSEEEKASESGSKTKTDHVPLVPKVNEVQDEHKPYSIYKMVKTAQSHRHLPEPTEDHCSLVKSLLQLKKFGDQNGLQTPTSVHSTTATTVSHKSAIRQVLSEPQLDLKRAPNPVERVVMVTARTLSSGKLNPAVTDVGSQPTPVKTSVSQSQPCSTVISGTVCTPPVVISHGQTGKVVFIAHHSQQPDSAVPPLSSTPCISATIVKPPGSGVLNASSPSPQALPSKTSVPNTFSAAASPGKFVISKHYL